MSRRSNVAVVAVGLGAVGTAAGVGAVMARRRRSTVVSGPASASASLTASHAGSGVADFGGLLRLPAGETRTVETDDGAQLAVTIAGIGPTVVFSHGWTNSAAAWAPVARILAESGHRVVLWDQRGHGASTVGRDRITLSRLGEDLRAVLDGVDARDAVLVGHSMGGMTTMALLGDHPEVITERSRALVLVATAAYGLARNPRADAIAERVVGSRWLTGAMAGKLGPRLTRGAVGEAPQRAQLAAMAALFAATSGETRAACFRAMAEMDLRPDLAACPVPVTVLVGARDQLTRQGLAQAIAAAIPGSRIEVLKGAGHMLQWERPERVAEIIAGAAAAVVEPSVGAGRR